MTSFGVIFHPRFPPESLADYARRAEAAGFDELWLWDDSFLPGALTSAAVALSATRNLKVGIGLMPATAYNPLFVSMEITTLACAFPGRILPGFGHGVGAWMEQVGAAPRSSLRALGETVTAVRQLLGGEKVTLHGEINLDQVQMQMTPASVPPLYVGAIREKTMRLAGRVGDGTILTEMSSPAYVRWAWEHIRAGMAEAGRTQHRLVVYLDVKVGPDAAAARAAVRKPLARQLSWVDIQLRVLGIEADAAGFLRTHTAQEAVEQIPDAWVDALSAAGTPEHAAEVIQRLADAGADSVVFKPMDGDPTCLDEYIRFLMPVLKK